MHCVTVFLKHYGTVLQCYCVTVTLRYCPTVTLVINMIIKLHNRVILRDMFSLNIKIFLVISAILQLHNRGILRITYQQSTGIIFCSVNAVIFKLSGD